MAIGPNSKELCGGTQVQSSGQIGLFKLTADTSIAAGVRRIEGVTGMGALEFTQRVSATLDQACLILKSAPDQ